ERRQMQTRLEYMAQHDQLTSLPNRQLFNDRLATAISRARRDQSSVGLLYLDLDKFKEVNDTYGHAVGDLLLTELARRLEDSVRASDTVARLGGDEFVVLLNDIQVPEQAEVVAEKIRRDLARPFECDGLSLMIIPSIGLVLFPNHGDDEKTLLIAADKAMYEAKRAGGDRLFMPAGPETAATSA
ncbi:MAG: GGDEF domain-containing protein, partial [Marinobacter sp.]|nr:GGDEF domain-containing protein [Marinobacter sp.]